TLTFPTPPSILQHNISTCTSSTASAAHSLICLWLAARCLLSPVWLPAAPLFCWREQASPRKRNRAYRTGFDHCAPPLLTSAHPANSRSWRTGTVHRGPGTARIEARVGESPHGSSRDRAHRKTDGELAKRSFSYFSNTSSLCFCTVTIHELRRKNCSRHGR